MLDVETSSLTAASSTGATITADAQLVADNSERNGLRISNLGATNALYLTLVAPGATTPAASATTAHVVVPAAGSWDGRVSGVLWTGCVRGFSTTTLAAIAEV